MAMAQKTAAVLSADKIEFENSEGTVMIAKKIEKWAERRNLNFCALAFGVGLLGLIDAITPGPKLNHVFGWLIVIVATYMWVLQ
jgi:hypothetical protein